MELGVNERLTFAVNWGAQYLEDGQRITSSHWSDPDGLTIIDEDFTPMIATVLLEWDKNVLPDPLDRTVRITNTIVVDDTETVEATLEVVGVLNTGRAQ